MYMSSEHNYLIESSEGTNKVTTMLAVFKKKKNIIIISLCAATCFILYQLYFYIALSSENINKSQIVPVLDHSAVKEVWHIRSESDKFINENGIFKGVLKQNFLKYRPDTANNFKCLNKDQSIPFDWVNDDFCDCDDGSDEPSTSACKDAMFYCDTQYKRLAGVNSVPSSRVNDGICDCCDGSDEWLNSSGKKLLSQSNSRHYRYYGSTCPNIC